jgi:ComF family protein
VSVTEGETPRAGPRRGGGVASRLGRATLDLLLPASCLGCGGPDPAGRAPFALCLACRGRLVPAPRAACPGCGEAPPGGRSARLCPACRRRPPCYAELVVPWSYEPPLDAVILALKFRRLPWLGRRLAVPLAAAVAGRVAGEAVVPVPLHWRRRLARGYNQAEAIARPLAACLGLPCVRALARRRATAAQTGLERAARRANVRHAFRTVPRRRADVAGRRVLLVDDVATTGATLDAAARSLLAAGAVAVTAVAVARTPARRPLRRALGAR